MTQIDFDELDEVSHPVIAPYWMIFDGCKLSYFQLTNYDASSKARALFNAVRKIVDNNQTKFVFLVQWADCHPFSSSVYPLQKVTFQLTLTSDGRKSYAIINYPYGKSQIDEESNFPLLVGYFYGSELEVFINKTGKPLSNFSYNMDLILGNTGISF